MGSGHSHPSGGADNRLTTHTYADHAARRKCCIPRGTRSGYARLCLPAEGYWSLLDRQQRPPRSYSFREPFRLGRFQIITHFLSPDTNPNKDAPDPLPFGSATWQSSLDSSKVWAQVLNGNVIPAGSDPSCPNSGAIACLLLQSIGSDKGPTGGKVMTNVTFVQRLNTKGGSAPTDGCDTAADVGKQTLQPYTADYYFFRKN